MFFYIASPLLNLIQCNIFLYSIYLIIVTLIFIYFIYCIYIMHDTLYNMCTVLLVFTYFLVIVFGSLYYGISIILVLLNLPVAYNILNVIASILFTIFTINYISMSFYFAATIIYINNEYYYFNYDFNITLNILSSIFLLLAIIFLSDSFIIMLTSVLELVQLLSPHIFDLIFINSIKDIVQFFINIRIYRHICFISICILSNITLIINIIFLIQKLNNFFPAELDISYANFIYAIVFIIISILVYILFFFGFVI